MARAYLRLSDDEFWSMAPRIFFAMLDEYWIIEDERSMLNAIAYHGQEMPKRRRILGKRKKPEPKKQKVYLHPLNW